MHLSLLELAHLLLHRKLIAGVASLAVAVTASDVSIAQAVSASDLATLNDIEALSLSPDGAWVAFQVRQARPETNRYDMAWHIVPVRGGKARRVADAGEPILVSLFGRITGFILPVAPVWSPDSTWVSYLKNERGSVQVWRTDREGQRTEQLTRNAGDVRTLLYSKDGRKLFFEIEQSRAQREAVLAQEGLSGHLYDERFFPSYGPFPVQPTDVAFGLGLRKNTTASQEALLRMWVYEFASHSERLATPLEREEFRALRQTPTPHGRDRLRGKVATSLAGALAWTEAHNPQLQGTRAPVTVMALPRGAKDAIACEAAECTGQRIEALWWRGEKEVIFLRREGPAFRDIALYAWRLGKAAPKALVRGAAQIASFDSQCAVSGEKWFVCMYEEPAHPRRLVAVDLDSGTVKTIYEPNPGFVRLTQRLQTSSLVFRSASEIETYGYLVLPPDYRRGELRSLVIVTYRCDGFLRGGTGDEYPIFAFAAQGHAVLCFDAPDTEWDRAARDSHAVLQRYRRGPGDPEKRRVQQALETAIAHLEEKGVIDPARVGVTGLSFGGEMVHYALFNKPSLAAGIASGSEIGPASTFLYGPAGGGNLASWGLDSPTSPRWESLSLARNANKMRSALLLNVADHEMVSSLDVFSSLSREGKAVEMYVFPDEYHIKWQPTHRLAIYTRNIDWMNFWLRGVEDSDPAKNAQYERWRAMRAKQCERLKGEVAPWYCRPNPDQSASQ